MLIISLWWTLTNVQRYSTPYNITQTFSNPAMLLKLWDANSLLNRMQILILISSILSIKLKEDDT